MIHGSRAVWVALCGLGVGAAVVRGTAPPPLPDAPRQAMAAVSADRLIADVERLAGFGTRHTLSAVDDAARGIGAARRWIKGELEATAAAHAGRMVVADQSFRQRPTQRVPREVELVNVLAAFPGRGVAADKAPESGIASLGRVFVLAHYDSRASEPNDAEADAPGANDNGSGTAAVLEIARALAAMPPMRHGVVLVLTAGEEQGLLGAKYLAEQVAARGEQVLAVINLDIVGDPKGAPRADGTIPADRSHIRLFSEGLPRNATAEQFAALRAAAAESDSTSRQIARFMVEVGDWYDTALKPVLVFRQDRFLRGGDHIPFNDLGIGAVRLTCVDEDYDRQHQNVLDPHPPGPDGKVKGDLPRFVEKEYLAGVTRLVAATVVSVANAPAPPRNVRVVTKDLGRNTTVRWSPGPEGEVAAYEMVWRDTTSPVWQHARSIPTGPGAANELTLEISKDDHLYGVRAVGGDGYKGVVVFAAVGKD